jgi:hypothetical protein
MQGVKSVLFELLSRIACFFLWQNRERKFSSWGQPFSHQSLAASIPRFNGIYGPFIPLPMFS